MGRPFVHTHEPYQKPPGEMDMNTTHKSTYRELPIERTVAFRPYSAKRSNAPFDSITKYASDYRWAGEHVQPHKVADYVPNLTPFKGSSTYKGHYVSHAIKPTYSCHTDNSNAFHSNAKFDDGTQYRHNYTPKPIHICEAAIIDQPTSGFRFSEFDSRGHKLYTPIQTSVVPLQLCSPMQSQQRLAMSMA